MQKKKTYLESFSICFAIILQRSNNVDSSQSFGNFHVVIINLVRITEVLSILQTIKEFDPDNIGNLVRKNEPVPSKSLFIDFNAVLSESIHLVLEFR